MVDVGDSKAVAAWIQQTVSDHGRLDSAVNLAGIIRVNHPLKDETDEAWARTMHINADGVFYCLRAELNVMKDGGSIVSPSVYFHASKGRPILTWRQCSGQCQ